MKVTVCELSDHERKFAEDWENLHAHVEHNQPDLLLLPEMPFCKWIASESKVDEATKLLSIEKHDRWMAALEQLPVPLIAYSRPVMPTGTKFYNTAYLFEKGIGHRKIHSKAFFPEEPHFWEASWYDAEAGRAFEPIEAGGLKFGALICTEMWFTQYARQYGKQGVDILLCPRATGVTSVERWIRCGQTLSIISGAYCLSSNRTGLGASAFQWGGNGWIAEPESGDLLGKTTAKRKFITKEIDLRRCRNAKKEYPLYVQE